MNKRLELISKKSTEKKKLNLSEKKEDTVGIKNYVKVAQENLKKFDEKAWAKGSGYALPSYPYIEEKLEGLESGLYLFAGESNSGKSATMMNLISDIANHEENNLFGVYYSLDDSSQEIIARVIAMNEGIPISVCAKPSRFQEKIDEGDEEATLFQTWLDKRQAGLDKLVSNSNKFIIEDSTTIRNSEDLYDHMCKVRTFVKAKNPNANIIVAFDSINDIKLSNYQAHSTEDRHAKTAETVKQWTVDLDIVIFASIHLRKLNGNRRPTMDDLKYSQEYAYEASLTWLIHNDVSKNKESAQIYYEQEDIEEKRPVIEMDWAKNKKSSYKGRSFMFFVPESSKTTECDRTLVEQFDSVIYEL